MYLPWPGLFDQIKNADIFVHYDDVQLPQGRSFCTRVQVKDQENISWISIPVIKSSRKLIHNVIIDESKDWKKQHLHIIKTSLSKAPFYQDVLHLVTLIFNQNIESLAKINILFIELISNYLGLKTQFFLSSDYHLTTHSTQKLLDLCKIFKATDYITGHGAKNYLNHELFEKEKTKVHYMKYEIEPYPQFGIFTPYISILDLIAHRGKESIHHLQSATIYWKEFLKND
jgi:hypothetical protein